MRKIEKCIFWLGIILFIPFSIAAEITDNVEGNLYREEKTNSNYILKHTNSFSVLCPSDWDIKTYDNDLYMGIPTLIEGKKNQVYIKISKIGDSGMQSRRFHEFFQYYNKNIKLPKGRSKIIKYMSKDFFKYGFGGGCALVSSSFENKDDKILTHMIVDRKDWQFKVYEVGIVNNDNSGTTTLTFHCNSDYFEKYLPIFYKCLESFKSK